MTLHALDVLGAAVRATREYRPRGLGEWLWVSAVALVVGGTGIGFPIGGPGGTGVDLPPAEGQTLGPIVLLVAVVVLWLLVIVLGALLEAPFLAWLRDGEVATWATVRDHLAQGLGLAVFRVVLKGLNLALLVGILVRIITAILALFLRISIGLPLGARHQACARSGSSLFHSSFRALLSAITALWRALRRWSSSFATTV